MRYDNNRGAAVVAEWPKRLPLTVPDKIFIVLTLAVMLAPLVHLALSYAALPAEIATDYSAGAVVETEPKWFLWILAGADVLCSLSVLICTFFPRAINLPPLLLKRPAAQIIRGTRLYLYFTSIACAGFFGYMLEVFLRCANGMPMTISGWAVFAFVVLIFASMAIYFIWLWCGDAASAPKGTEQGHEARQRAAVMRDWPVRLPFSLLDKVLFGVSLLLVLLTLVRLAMVYGSLPEIIPSHYGMDGVVDATDDKNSLLILAGVDVLCWVLVVVCNFFPQTINVPVFLMKRSGEEIVRGTRVLMHVIAIICAALFWYLIEATVQVAVGAAVGISSVVMFGFIGALMLACLIYFIWLWRA